MRKFFMTETTASIDGMIAIRNVGLCVQDLSAFGVLN